MGRCIMTSLKLSRVVCVCVCVCVCVRACVLAFGLKDVFGKRFSQCAGNAFPPFFNNYLINVDIELIFCKQSSLLHVLPWSCSTFF